MTKHRSQNLNDLRPKAPTRSPFPRILIVCEGEKTEPFYLQSLADDLRLNKRIVEIREASGSSPRSVVQDAKESYKREIKRNGGEDSFDRVYCVMDRDEHATYDEALNSIQTAKPEKVFHAITSNPCFEIWLLCYFICSTKAYTRTGNRSPGENVKHELKSKYLPSYEEGNKTIYQQLKKQNMDIDTAIANARFVNNAGQKSGFDNPSTAIPELVEYLINLKKR
ncbi:MAG: RloB family protein [Chloroflexota bacterium]